MISFQLHPEGKAYRVWGDVKLGYLVNTDDHGWVFNPMPDTGFKPGTLGLIAHALEDANAGKELDGLALKIETA